MADKPVQSQFGWHVIEVVDVRPIEFPPLDQVKAQLEDMMRQQALASYQQELREKAVIK
jgi:peptidyl-prolyl cis-trans isomerase C